MPTPRVLRATKSVPANDVRNVIFPSRRAVEERKRERLLPTIVVEVVAALLGLSALAALVLMVRAFAAQL